MGTVPVQPPAGVDPSALFLTLCEWRPRMALAMCLQAAPEAVLGVQAVTAAEFERAHQAGPAALLAACLLADGEPAFGSAADAAFLDAEEEGALVLATIDALDRIGPLFRRVDYDAWLRILRDGAKAVPWVARGFMSSVDLVPVYGGDPFKREHPERYWGRSPVELLDGHWLAFRAAVDVLYR